MRYIVFGAGRLGKTAFLHFLGRYRVEYFAETHPAARECLGKTVLSYNQMKELLAERPDEYVVYVASTRYCAEMVQMLRADGILNYCLYYDALPIELWNQYPTYALYDQAFRYSWTQTLSACGIYRYKQIAIYGDSFFLQYLIAEIGYQTGSLSNIAAVVPQLGKTEMTHHAAGIPVKDMEAVWNEADCFVVNCRHAEDEIFDYLESRPHEFEVIDLYNADLHIPHFWNQKLAKFRDIHRGERCFLIGNGPSLRVEDLNTLHQNHAICFGFNMIYKIYDKTAWRPDYYGISDGFVYTDALDVIKNLPGEKIFADEWNRLCVERIANANYVHYILQDFDESHPNFAKDITKGIYWGYSCIYDIGLQFAAYMGFDEIYLLGVDMSYQGNPMDPGNHFIDDYLEQDRRAKYNQYPPNIKKNILAFESAKKYAEKHGVKIYNATRGGKLEVFERADFDALF